MQVVLVYDSYPSRENPLLGHEPYALVFLLAMRPIR